MLHIPAAWGDLLGYLRRSANQIASVSSGQKLLPNSGDGLEPPTKERQKLERSCRGALSSDVLSSRFDAEQGCLELRLKRFEPFPSLPSADIRLQRFLTLIDRLFPSLERGHQ